MPESSTAETKKRMNILLRCSEEQTTELEAEAKSLTVSEGRHVSPTEVVRRRTFPRVAA